jgi:hypothetical protein
MTRYLLLAAALAACSGKTNRADSVDAAIPAIDTLKQSESKSESPPTQTQPQTQTGGRDSAFPPPRNLPRLDTLKKKRPI